METQHGDSEPKNSEAAPKQKSRGAAAEKAAVAADTAWISNSGSYSNQPLKRHTGQHSERQSCLCENLKHRMKPYLFSDRTDVNITI